MRRIINSDKIAEISGKMTEKLNMIENAKKDLLLNIEKIGECYQGVDANIIKAKYIKTIENLNKITGTISSYIKYFNWLSDNCSEIVLDTINNFSSFENELATPNLNLEINDNTLNIATIDNN